MVGVNLLLSPIAQREAVTTNAERHCWRLTEEDFAGFSVAPNAAATMSSGLGRKEALAWRIHVEAAHILRIGYLLITIHSHNALEALASFNKPNSRATKSQYNIHLLIAAIVADFQVSRDRAPFDPQGKRMRSFSECG